MRNLRLWFFGFMIVSAPCMAQDYQRGVGTWTCQNFVENIVHTDVQVAAYSWAMGYVAGINTASIVDRDAYLDVSKADDVTVLAGMIAFCRDNPSQQVIAAADALLPHLPRLVWPGR